MGVEIPESDLERDGREEMEEEEEARKRQTLEPISKLDFDRRR